MNSLSSSGSMNQLTSSSQKKTNVRLLKNTNIRKQTKRRILSTKVMQLLNSKFPKETTMSTPQACLTRKRLSPMQEQWLWPTVEILWSSWGTIQTIASLWVLPLTTNQPQDQAPWDHEGHCNRHNCCCSCSRSQSHYHYDHRFKTTS